MKASLWALLTAATMAAVPAGSVLAQAYPTKPIKLVVPYSTGGGTDILARHLSGALAEALNQPVIVENRPGASGNIGMDTVAKAAADGYTLLLGDQTLAVNPSLILNMPINPMKDLMPVALVARAPVALIVHPSLKVNTVSELIKLAQAQPGKLSYASAGKGNTTFLCPEVLKLATNIDVLHVPYKGAGAALTDVVGGQVSMMCAGLSSARPFIENGRVKALAIIGTKRAPGMPTVPTFQEAGYPMPELDNGSWWGILGPAGLPSDVTRRLSEALAKVLSRPDVQKSLMLLNIEPDYRPAAQMQKLVASETATWAEVFRKAKIAPE